MSPCTLLEAFSTFFLFLMLKTSATALEYLNTFKASFYKMKLELYFHDLTHYQKIVRRLRVVAANLFRRAPDTTVGITWLSFQLAITLRFNNLLHKNNVINLTTYDPIILF